MQPIRAARAMLPAAACLIAITDAAAQSAPPPSVFWRSDVFAVTQYHWRGIRRVDRPVLQGDVMGGIALGRISLSTGAWADLELLRSRPRRLSDFPVNERGIGEWSGWGQASWRSPRVTVSAGALYSRYLAPDIEPSVTELFGAVRYQLDRWQPSISGAWVVSGARGAYLEPALAFHHFVNPFTGPGVAWTTTLSSGWQIGHRRPDAGALVPGPRETGLTHVGLSSGVRLVLNLPAHTALVIATGPSLQISRDSSARLRGSGRYRAARLWWPFQLGLSVPLRRPE